MSRTRRTHQIDQLLHNSKVVSLQTFLDELEVSLATFKRDLEFMRDQLNAPIVFDRELGGYRFDKVSSDGPVYELPGLWLNGAEAFALLTAHELLESIEPGLLGPYVAPIKSRILSLLADEKISPETVAQKVRLTQKMRRQANTKFFSQIAHATLTGVRVELSHFNRHTQEHTKREVSPIRLTHYRDNWYVDTYCHTKQAIRSFAIDAIEGVQLLQTPIKPVSAAQLDKALGEGYGIFRGPKKEMAEIALSPSRAQWNARIVWHEKQKSWWSDEGWFHVTFPYTDDREVISDILALLPDVKVISPPSLQAKLREVLQAASAMHTPSTI